MTDFATCPRCSTRTELTPKTRRFRKHTVNGSPCLGSGKKGPTKKINFKSIKVIAPVSAGVIGAIAGLTAILAYAGVGPFTSSSQPTSAATTAPPFKVASSSLQLVSSSSTSKAANGDSGRPSFDASGRYVVFTSAATNLAPGAANGHYNIYRKDRESGDIYLASSGLGGSPSNGDSQFPVICSTGRFIAFASIATNLVPPKPGIDGTNYQVYVNDSLTHQTYLVSANDSGTAANGDSRNPMFTYDCSSVVFESTATNLSGTSGRYNIYVRNLLSNSVTLASASAAGSLLNGDSTHAAISPSGTMVAFTSWATNLPKAIAGMPAVYLRNLQTNQIINVSSAFRASCPTAKGFSWPAFSPDGRYLVFTSVNASGNPDFRGNCVLVWDVSSKKSAIAGATGSPVGWSDACVTGINNGTTFAPQISDATRSHPYLVLFTIAGKNGTCSLVLRDLQGDDIPVKSQVNQGQILEPSLNSSGDYLSWDVAGDPQEVYACKVASCADSFS
jgi:Tol biopolymer transport system component